MAKPTIRIHDIETNEVIDREMTDAEFAQFQADNIASQTKAQAEATKVAERASLLAKLGIADDETKLLLS
jgi:hypothetical protein